MNEDAAYSKPGAVRYTRHFFSFLLFTTYACASEA